MRTRLKYDGLAGAVRLLCVVALFAVGGCKKEAVVSTPAPTPTAAIRARIDLWATDHQVDADKDLTVIRNLSVPAGYEPDLPDLDAEMRRWGLFPSPVRVEDQADGGTLRREMWSGQAKGQGVLRIPQFLVRLDGPAGVLRLSHPELLVRIGADPEGPLPAPAPAGLSVMPLPAAPAGSSPRGRWIVLLLFVLLGAAGVGMRWWVGNRAGVRETPVPRPLDLLREALAGGCDLRVARAMTASYLVEVGALAPGQRDEESLRAAAVAAGWPARELAEWFTAGRDALYAGVEADDARLVSELLGLLDRTAARSGSDADQGEA